MSLSTNVLSFHLAPLDVVARFAQQITLVYATDALDQADVCC